mmetsp:Transcript_10701/g.18749  ORF Transcript_10701/g.18749 Transcript_10701/m.18749 type:complete len:309 (-) Transcript_10701:1242-2168(-)
MCAALLGQLLHQRRHQGLVAGSLGTDTHHVHISIDGLLGHLLGGAEERTHVHIVAQITETTSNHLGASVVTVLAHLRDQHTRTSALLLGEGLDLVQHTLVLLLDALAVLDITCRGGVEGCTVGALHYLGGSHVAAPLSLQGRGDLTQGGALASSGHGQLQQVVLLVVVSFVGAESGRGSELGQGRLHLRLVTTSLGLANAFDLGLQHRGVVDAEHIHGLGLARRDAVLVHTHHHVLTSINARLLSSGGLLDAELGHTGLDGFGHAAQGLHLFDDLQGCVSQLLGECLHHVRTAPGVRHVGDLGLLLQD